MDNIMLIAISYNNKQLINSVSIQRKITIILGIDRKIENVKQFIKWNQIKS